ncbi:MAG: polysaccharide lyase family 8 super-sandwich domain-containing protein [Bacteroidaceae bacterium]
MKRKTQLLGWLLCLAGLAQAQTYTASDISVAGTTPKGITIQGDALYAAFSGDNKVVKTSLDGKTVLLELTGLNKPFDVAVDGQGRIFVANQGSKTIGVYDAQGVLQATLDIKAMDGSAVGGTLSGVAVDAQGRLFATVGASAYNGIHVFNTDLQQTQVLTKMASNSIAGCDKFRVMRDVFFSHDGAMFIIDQNTGILKVASYDDDTVTPAFLIKRDGSGANAYNNVAGMAETSNGNLLVSLDANKSSGGQTISYRGVYRFNALGAFVDQIATADDFGSPYGLAVDASDNLYVADAGKAKVVRWNASDVTAPIPSKQSIDRVTRSTVDFSLMADEAATVYWTVGAAGEMPTVEAVKQGASFALAEGGKLYTETLTVGSVTDQVIFYVLADGLGNTSEVFATETFTTAQPLAMNTLFALSRTADAVTMEAMGNDNGTLYWMLTQEEKEPTAAEVEQGTGAWRNGSTAVAKGGTCVTFDLDNLSAQRYYLYACLKSGSEYSEVRTTVVMPAGDAEIIYQRYFTFLTGDNPDYTNEQVKTRYQALMALVASAKQKLATYQWEEGLAPYDFNTKCADLRDLLGNVLVPLSMCYQLQGPAADPNADYHDASLRADILDLFTYLEKRGFAPGCDLGFGTDGPYLGLAGYFYAGILMREELQRAGQWETVGATMRWLTRMVTDDNADMNSKDQVWGLNTKHNGMRSDGVRSVYHNRLMALAAQTDEDLAREADLDYLLRVLEVNLSVNSAWDGFIKPDYTGYHHYGPWGNAYNIDALHTSCQMAMMLRETSYALSETALANLANSLLAFRQYSGKYDINRGLCGRFPNQLSTLLSNMPAFAYLYQAIGGEMKERIGGAFCRLYDPAYSGVVGSTLKDVKCDIYFHGGLQAVQLMNQLKAKELTDTEVEESNCAYPYAAMQVHRRGDWMVSAKGYSKYVWDFETNSGQNWIGRNQSAGGLAIYATKDAEGVVTAAASGLGYDGWDWVHVPGATVLDMSIDDIVQEAKYFEWAKFSPRSYVGGVSLEGKHGMYAMIYDDIRQAYDYANKRAWLGVKLTANKSYFFFDDEVVALGSAIKNTHATYDAHTTLFQNALQTADTPLYVNGEAKTGLTVDETQSTDAPCYLTDAVGNGYVIPNANGLHLTRATQTSVKDANTATTTTGNYAKAWLDHGKNTDGSYEYLIYVGGADKVKAMSGTPDLPYVVQQRDATAHIVYHPAKGLKGYAFFQTSAALDDNYLSAVSVPCMAMLREVDKAHINLSVCNPELGFYPADKFPYQVWAIDGSRTYLDSEEQPVDVTLKGNWTLASTYEQVERLAYDETNDLTTFRFHGKDAQSLEVALVNEGVVDIAATTGDASVSAWPCPFADRLTVELPAEASQVQLCDVSGRVVLAQPAQGRIVVFATASLASGLYFLQVDGQPFGRKLLKQ